MSTTSEKLVKTTGRNSKTPQNLIETTRWTTNRYEMPSSCSNSFLPPAGPAGALLRDQGVSLAGISEVDSGYIHRQTDPSFHSLLYTLEGKGLVRTPDNAYFIEPAQVGILPAHSPFEATVAHDYWKVMWFQLEDTEHWSPLRLFPTRVRPAGFTQSLVCAVEGLLWESLHGPPGAEHISHLLCEVIVSYLDRETRLASSPGESDALQVLQRLWDTVNANLGRRWTVAELAREARMSPSNLHRLVALHMGTTPVARVRQLRMRRAEALLRYGRLPVNTIAYSVGYDNPFSFSTAFKKYHGFSPRQFREQDTLRP